MKWKKLGLVCAPSKKLWWNQLYAILPTPVYLDNLDLIRVFFATTCEQKFGRITYIDLDPEQPTNIIFNPKNIVLDVGVKGAFDDCGVNVSSVIKTDSDYFMYYAGYQRHFRTPFSILSGLAISKDLETFKRNSQTPVLERIDTELDLRSAPTVLYEAGKFRMWYVAGKKWEMIEGEVHKNKLMPIYELKYGESNDGKTWDTSEDPVFNLHEDEFGFGRPYIFKDKDNYKLFYSIRRKSVSYRLGFAESNNGCDWVRKDSQIGIDVSNEGWDSEMICYPAVITVHDKTYLFYNGNNNGETGFGVAELVEE
ncbi:hypothetical protein M3O96_19195 [Aquiflexum sp. TKW24L]|uniref:hypothetical protein n=1 Tax=Aquiflexum sp. TKW24L TaxID=2942212 RepID=UPI0020C06F6E|nr:hypothetical protein [Aquiflexum sp. TKW24L]MCL6261236.1 hypothetical protein [Aquiflexum sp. TKW24L]